MEFLKNLLGTNESENAHQQIYYGHEKHKASWTHELIGGAAGFAAMKAYEDHVRRTGEQVSHPFMKELLAGFAAAEVDRLIETKGLDFIDRERAKRQAVQQAHHLAEQQYGPGGVGPGGPMNYGGNYGQQEGFPGGPMNYAGNYGQQGGGYPYQQPQFDQGYGQNQMNYDYQSQFGNPGYQQQQPYGEEHHHHHHKREEW